MHERAHDKTVTELRGDLLTVRGMPVFSRTLGVSGTCDVVEFRRSEKGIALVGRPGTWLPYPIEYKRGRPKTEDADRLQICCQAMCLEEMLLTEIFEGSLYYGETHHREVVEFTPTLRDLVQSELTEMHKYTEQGYTPKVRTGNHCRACSINELCLPKLNKNLSATKYVAEKFGED
jgi:CRISPR-associated exonuclease Cas4